MATSDWKDLLGALIPENEKENPAPKATDIHAPVLKQNLIIRFEKRNGKPATIVSNFEGPESELKELAAAIKKHCGTGGSAKDDEILIQGDVRKKVAEYLQSKGHRVKGDFR
jgi:translation initiation factor 1